MFSDQESGGFANLTSKSLSHSCNFLPSAHQTKISGRFYIFLKVFVLSWVLCILVKEFELLLDAVCLKLKTDADLNSKGC